MRVARRPNRCALASMALVVLTTGALPAVADDAARESEQQLQRGVEFRQSGKNAEALAAFERAYALAPSALAVAQIALARQALGDWVGAERGLQDALANGADPWIARYRGALEQALATVRAHLGSLQIVTNVPDGEVSVGGAALALPLTNPLRVAAGTTQLEVRANGYRPEQRSVNVEPGATVRVVVVLSAAPTAGAATPLGHVTEEPKPPPAPPSRLPAFVALGTSGALTAAGIVAWRVREDAIAVYNDNSRCRVGSLTRAEQCAGWSQSADVALGVEIGAFVGAGVAAALGGWALVRAQPHSSSATLRCAPWIGAGVTCEHSF